jgi:hypothetical protein
MFSKLIDSLFPTHFAPLSDNPQQWTGDALPTLLKPLDPARPSHRARALAIRSLIDDCIANSRDAQRLGSAASVRSADYQKLTVFSADLCADYRTVSRFIQA